MCQSKSGDSPTDDLTFVMIPHKFPTTLQNFKLKGFKMNKTCRKCTINFPN